MGSSHKKPLAPETEAALRASATALCWKRAKDLPAELRITEATCTTPAGIKLFYSTVFPPANKSLRGVVAFVHGINEHSQRYFHVFQALAEMGFGVFACDLRSHGMSEMDVPGLRAHVNSFQEFIDDINAFLTFVKQDLYPKMCIDSRLPLVIGGMSLGTLISLHTVLSQRHEVAGIVLIAPAVSVEMTFVLTLQSYLSAIFSTLMPTARLVPGVNQSHRCRDPLVLAECDADPLTTNEKVTTRVGAETMLFTKKLKDNTVVEDPRSAFCQTPILMIMGSSDKVTSLPLAQEFFERIKNADKQFELIDGAFHGLFEDFERARVMELIRQWLQLRFPAKS